MITVLSFISAFMVFYNYETQLCLMNFGYEQSCFPFLNLLYIMIRFLRGVQKQLTSCPVLEQKLLVSIYYVQKHEENKQSSKLWQFTAVLYCRDLPAIVSSQSGWCMLRGLESTYVFVNKFRFSEVTLIPCGIKGNVGWDFASWL